MPDLESLWLMERLAFPALVMDGDAMWGRKVDCSFSQSEI